MIRRVVDDFFNLFFTPLCVVCKQRLLRDENSLCLNCLSRIPKINNLFYVNNLTEQLLEGRFPFVRAVSFAIFHKEGIMQVVIHEIKYKGNTGLGEFMGRIFGREMHKRDFCSDIDFIVPVPLHPKKQKARGYNQAEVISRGLAFITGIPLSTDNLVRIENTPSQTNLGKDERSANVKDAFALKESNLFENKHILLVDDVITTGSTIEACAKAVLSCANTKISVATLAEAVM